MKTKQRNIRVFEIECDNLEEAKAYLQKNYELIKGLLLAVKGREALEICNWAHQNGMCAFAVPECFELPKKQAVSKTQLKLFDEDVQQKDDTLPILSSDSVMQDAKNEMIQTMKKTVINRVLRSGEIVETNGDAVVFGRINSGAKVIAKGCVEIFDEIDGLVECDGEYMILRSIGKGSVVFCSETIKKDILKWDLQRVFFENGTIQARKI